MSDKLIYFPGTKQIITPPDPEVAVEFIAPLESIMESALSGNTQAYAVVAANDDGTHFAIRWRPQVEMGRMMALLAALELVKASLLRDIEGETYESQNS